jgi:putative phosphoribosyl transferase
MSNYQRFPNRVIAGQQLAQKLQTYQNCSNGLVLALPRGGVPVAFPIAQSLDFPLDLCLVRKLGAPERPELAMGAIAGGNIQVMNPDIVNWLGITAAQIASIVEQEQQELERRAHCYRGQKPFPNLSDHRSYHASGDRGHSIPKSPHFNCCRSRCCSCCLSFVANPSG